MATDERARSEYQMLSAYEGYTVYDEHGEKIGKVDYLFVDENNRPEYVGVKTGLFGMRTTLVPMEMVRVYDRDNSIDVAESKDRVKEGPNFDRDDEITSEFEARVLGHYGLRSSAAEERRGSYGDYYPGTTSEEGHSSEAYGEKTETAPVREEREEPREGSRERPDASTGVAPERTEGESHGEEPRGVAEDEVRDHRDDEPRGNVEVGREESGVRTAGEGSEERTGTEAEDRQAGGMRIRKRARAENEPGRESSRQEMRVPIKREKARVERVPNEEGGEELRVRKEVVEEEETVEVEDRGERAE